MGIQYRVCPLRRVSGWCVLPSVSLASLIISSGINRNKRKVSMPPILKSNHAVGCVGVCMYVWQQTNYLLHSTLQTGWSLTLSMNYNYLRQITDLSDRAGYRKC